MVETYLIVDVLDDAAADRVLACVRHSSPSPVWQGTRMTRPIKLKVRHASADELVDRLQALVGVTSVSRVTSHDPPDDPGGSSVWEPVRPRSPSPLGQQLDGRARLTSLRRALGTTRAPS
jgi:hypothetical protein